MTSRNLRVPQSSHDMRQPPCIGVSPPEQNLKSHRRHECWVAEEVQSTNTPTGSGHCFENYTEKGNQPMSPANKYRLPPVGSNMLVQLCRKQCWRDAWVRVRSYPDEAFPVLMNGCFSTNDIQSNDNYESRPWKRTKSEFHQSDDWRDRGVHNPFPIEDCLHTLNIREQIHFVTALGVVCQTHCDDSNQMVAIVDSLLYACPQQVRCSQTVKGHTPLRDAVRNKSCPPNAIKLMLQADRNISSIKPNSSDKNSVEDSGKDEAVFLPDRDGLYPLDHVIMGINSGKPSHSLETFQIFLSIFPELMDPVDSGSRRMQHPLNDSILVPPLIRLLSLSSSSNTSSNEYRLAHKHSFVSESYSITKAGRAKRILDCVQYLLPSKGHYNLVQMLSASTKCTPLHLAVRNHGDILPLIQILIDSDPRQLSKRNRFGDLPIHVATSVGVPTEVLKLLIECTVAKLSPQHSLSCSSQKDNDTNHPHPLLWSVNNAGHTPIDLEWMRHIEGGYGICDRRFFNPVNSKSNGRKRYISQKGSFYRELMEEAVNQVVVIGKKSNNHLLPSKSSKTIDKEAKIIVGETFLERIIYIVQAAHNSSCLKRFQLYNKTSSNGERFVLHAASALSRISGPYLPMPLLQLLLDLYPTQVLCRDEMGRLPLHYSLMLSSLSAGGTLFQRRNQTTNIESILECSHWIKLLLKRAPSSASVADASLRLPINYALDSQSFFLDDDSKGLSSSTDAPPPSHTEKLKAEWEEVVWELVDAFPDSLERRDPQTLLYPFMQAATNCKSSLNTVFSLLRRSPSLCCVR